jgi:hypothetical protein
MYLTDDRTRPTKWRIPPTQPLAAGATLLVWADEDQSQGPLHANFKLAQAGEEILLFDSDGVTLLDEIVFGPQLADVSTGRLRDGEQPWVTFLDPSPRARNEVQPCGTRRYSALDPSRQPIDLALLGSPGLGKPVTLLMQQGPPLGLHFAFLAFDAGEFELPISPYRLLLFPPLLFFDLAVADAAGSSRISFQVPVSQDLVGNSVWFQGFGVTASNAVVGTSGLEIKICQ